MKNRSSARSAVQEGPKTRPKCYKSGVSWPRTGARKEREGVFNTLGYSPKFAHRKGCSSMKPLVPSNPVPEGPEELLDPVTHHKRALRYAHDH